jgi:hypothetical protein
MNSSMIRPALIALAVLLLAGCGGDSGSSGSNACGDHGIALPTTTPGVQCCIYVDILQCYPPPSPPICGPGPTCPTPTPTPTAAATASSTPTPNALASPTPTFVIISYRLTEGSTISFAPPVSDLADIAPEPLSGTFDLEVPPFPPGEGNVLFAFGLTRVDFRSADFSIVGHMGSLAALTLHIPVRVTMQATVVINDQSVSLSGTDLVSAVIVGDHEEVIRGLAISGAGYSLKIFAASVTGPAADATFTLSARGHLGHSPPALRTLRPQRGLT